MELKTPAFNHNGDIPKKYTCEGENVSPILLINGAPENTKSLALIMDDPDATGGRTFDHWLMWNISPDTKEIEEGTAPAGAVQGGTGFGKNEYGGPCPPVGSSKHRYMLKLYALDAVFDLPEGTRKAELEKAMEGHVLEQAVLTGLFSR